MMDTNKDKDEETTTDPRLQAKLVVYNDETNTFLSIMTGLITVCGHNPIQAEQCALLIHYTKECIVKTGHVSKMTEMETALKELNINAEMLW